MQVRDLRAGDGLSVQYVGGATKSADLAVRPTPERFKRGEWRLPQGMGKHNSPAVDITADLIGLMYENKFITNAQEQAARMVQTAWAGYIAEMGVSQGRSCLDMSPVGHDGGDGNPDAMQAWRDISAKLTYWQEGALLWTVINGRAPANVELVRSALDVVAGVKGRLTPRKEYEKLTVTNYARF